MIPRWVFFTFLIVPMEALRILVVYPFPSPSHNLLGRSVVRHLLEANHEVVHITPFPYDRPIQNLTVISIEDLGQQILKELDNDRVYSVSHLIGFNNRGHAEVMLYFSYDFHKRVLAHENITRFLSDPEERFDVVVMEWFFSELVVGIPALFECPFIWVASTDAHWQVLSLIGELPNPVYTPDMLDLSPPVTIWERMYSLFSFVKKYFVAKIFFGTLQKSSFNSIYPSIASKRGITMPDYDNVLNNASLLFVNSHPSSGVPHNLPLNAKYIGGYHINTDVKPMPKHLQNLMDNAQHGVIYFSLGTNLESKYMSKSMIEGLLAMFSTLKQTVIWKFEDDLQNVPANVHLEKWAPQLNILGHPNLKIFITHGGRLSLLEATHYGVPVICIPMFGDQFLNVKNVVKINIGVGVTLTEDLADDLSVAIGEVLDNQMYTNVARELSTYYHHRLLTPGQELVYWTEHTAKTRGAKYLIPTALNLPMYQKLYLDVILIIAFTVWLAVFVWSFVKRDNMIVKEKTN